jgi:hypothetical protein
MVDSHIHSIWVSIVGKAIQDVKNGLSRWQKIDDNHWLTKDGSYPLEIELLTPVDESEAPLKGTVARISIYQMSFVTLACSGTQLMYTVRELLSHVDEEWRELINFESRCLEQLQAELR